MIKSRIKTNPLLRNALTLKQDEVITPLVNVIRAGMVPIEHIDAYANALGFTAYANYLYDQKVNEAKKSLELEELDADTLAAIEKATLEEVEVELSRHAQPINKTQLSAMSVMGGGLGKMLGFLGSDSISKISDIWLHLRAGRIKAAARAYITLSIAEQSVMAGLILFSAIITGDTPDTDEEWKAFWITQVLGGAIALPASIPAVGGLAKAVPLYLGYGKYYSNYASQLINVDRAVYASKRLASGKKRSTAQITQDVAMILEAAAPFGGVPMLSSSCKYWQYMGSTLMGLVVADNPFSVVPRKKLLELLGLD